MKRAVDFVVRNWPLKLGAILLATVLYSGLVLAQNVRTWSGKIPIDPIRPPAGATLINELDPVQSIRYRAPLDVGVLSPDSFRATVDLSRVEAQPGGPSVTLPVALIALDARVQIVDYEPHEVAVQLDPVQDREMPVTVMLGSVPDTVTVGPPQTDPSTVIVRGASSRVNALSAVQARVTIDASALNVDRDVDLVAVDANGNEVPNVQLDPQRVRVRIAVAQELATRSLPIVPRLIGIPAAGYRITSVSVEPLTVTVSGEAATVSLLDSAPTASIDISGRSDDLDAEVGLALPVGVSVTGADRVRVRLTFAQETGTQTFGVGVVLAGEQSGFVYDLATPQVNVTLGGPTTALQALDATRLTATADVSSLTEGTRSVRLTFDAPPELQLIAIDPVEISIIVAPPSPSATGLTSP